MESLEDLHSWQQAFEAYSMSSTRAIEKQLRTSVANDKGRLRGLVGNNYRELLASAEQIVLLEVQTKKAEKHISGLGQKCQPSAAHRQQNAKQPQRHIVVQLRLLQRCLSQAKVALRHSDVLQCSQLVVVARLLAKSLDDANLPAVASLRDKVASLRRALLRNADLKLTSPLTEPPEMIKACCAYCLITSSSSSDALKHVQGLKLDKLRNLLSSDSLSQQGFVGVLRYYLDSLQALRGLSGRTLIDALSNLQKRPILEDNSLSSIELLDLRNVGPLLPHEVQSFMPYFKRTPLTPNEVQQMLDSWSSEALQAFSLGLQEHLSNITSCGDLFELRRQLYIVLLPVFFSSAGHKELHKTLRSIFEAQVKAMSSGLGQDLSKITLGLTQHLDSSTNAVGSLWQPELVQISLSNGGLKFLEQIERRRLGRSARQTNPSKAIKVWITDARRMREELAELHKMRWRDQLEEPDDEQQDEADYVVRALTHEDPQSYSGHLQESLTAGLAMYESILCDAVAHLADQEEKGRAAVNLLRAVRDSMACLQSSFATEHRFDKLTGTLPQLHGYIADEVVVRLSATESTKLHGPSSSSSLDDLPSPRAFAFLRQLCSLMLEIGSTDVWSPSAVYAVKSAIASHIFGKDRKEHYMETSFDDGYLRIALQQPPFDGQTLPSSQKKAVEDYWLRTKLLFSVLAQ